MGTWKLKEVGIDFDSVQQDYGMIAADCDIIGEEDGEETCDSRSFTYDPYNGEVLINHLIEGDRFSEEDYREAELLLQDSISDNKDAFLKAASHIIIS